VNQVNSATEATEPDLQSEVVQLRQALAMREQLIAQLSQALYAQIKQPSDPKLAGAMNAMGVTPTGLNPQMSGFQQQFANQAAEIASLRQNNKQLSERNQMLERVIQELPQVYRQKFSDRLSQVKAKMEALQRENRQLQTDLHQINCILTGRGRDSATLALPNAQLGKDGTSLR
jgi:chromosome segregation ATPase